ncbi:MAG: SLC13 family permease [Elusimicrobiota bacterium]
MNPCRSFASRNFITEKSEISSTIRAEEKFAGDSINSENELTVSAGITLSLIMGLILLFLWEPGPIYTIVLGIPVLLTALKPWTGISSSEAISGFSNEATITIMAMFILSEGIQQTGLIQVLGDKISTISGKSIIKQVAIITGLSGPVAGIINNTPVVAIFIPMVSNLAHKVKTSPSKLMIPLSYAAMMGGTLTVIGSSTNLITSDISARLLDKPFSFFEFTAVGIVILVVGLIYLIFIGHRLLPERLKPKEDLTQKYEMGNFLTELIIERDSEFIGKNVSDVFPKFKFDIELVQIIREGEKFMEPLQVKTLRENDHLLICTNRENLLKILDREGVEIFSRKRVSEKKLEEPEKGQTVAQIVIPRGSFLDDVTLKNVNFSQRYDATILAIRRGEKLSHDRLDNIKLKSGDVLLILATETTLNRLRANRNFIVEEKIEPSEYRRAKTPIALGILGAVILLAALDIVPIVISALGGAILMCATGCIKPNDLHEAVDWEVIFLIAGLIPLGMAMERSGAASYVAYNTLRVAKFLPPLGILALFYLVTAVLTNLIHKNASLILMAPVAVNAATGMGLNPFPFLITVMMASSTAFLTPVGNQTNLMVYGPGGYKFGDFFRVGAPLQLILTGVVPLTVNWIWPMV